MMRLRELSDGTLVAPHRGKPPACPDGYTTDINNPLIFHPVILDCKYRTTKQRLKSCCKRYYQSRYCLKMNKFVNNKDCKGCQDLDKEI